MIGSSLVSVAACLSCLVAAALAQDIPGYPPQRKDGDTMRVAVAPEWGRSGEVTWVVHPEAQGHGAAAVATFEDRLQTHGWGMLNVETNDAFPDVDQAFAAGMAEGYLTAQDIYEAQQNLYPNVFGANVLGVDQVRPEIVEWMDRQEAWTRVMVSTFAGEDPFWAQVGNVVAQYDGLIAGYEAAVEHGFAPKIHRFAFAMLNGVGDLLDIVPSALKEERMDWSHLTIDAAELKHTRAGHCSGLIKLPGDFSDIFVSHSSWFTYSNTNRIFKHYFLNFRDASTAARRVSLSSYPGFLESLDDFYMLDSGLGWIQTTNSVVDHSVYESVKPESLLAWQRVRVASAMSHSGREWYENVRRHSSGTYANQYMVIDFKLFEPGHPAKPNLLWVIEDMPGLTVGGDQTETLARGYWPSYNVPFYPEVYNRSGYAKMAASHGNYFTYELAPRAKIFRRDQGKVTDLESLKLIMRYNDYQHDPLSVDSAGERNPTYAICSRGDLHAKNASADGCYDTKVTSYNSGAMRGIAQAINGPPTHQSLPPFTWDHQQFLAQKHVGLPEIYVFDFVDIAPARPYGFPVPGKETETTLFA